MKFKQGSKVKCEDSVKIYFVCRPWRGAVCHDCKNNNDDEDFQTCWDCEKELDDELEYVINSEEVKFHGHFKPESQLTLLNQSPIQQIKVVQRYDD